MNATEVNISRDHVRKLLATASPDAAMVYLYVSCGNPLEGAEQALKMGAGRIGCAVATLRQLGLWEEPKKTVIPMGERPNYTENDVFEAMDQDFDFRILGAVAAAYVQVDHGGVGTGGGQQLADMVPGNVHFGRIQDRHPLSFSGPVIIAHLPCGNKPKFLPES